MNVDRRRLRNSSLDIIPAVMRIKVPSGCNRAHTLGGEATLELERKKTHLSFFIYFFAIGRIINCTIQFRSFLGYTLS